MDLSIKCIKLLFVTVGVVVRFCNGQQAGQCQDNFSSELCKAYKETNQCPYVGESCSLTCGACSPPAPVPPALPPTVSSCVDKNTQCPSWAASGFCATVTDVRSYCQKSCNQCPQLTTPSWGEWGSYGPCSSTCGNGEKTRYRSCLHTSCIGRSYSVEVCFVQSCGGTWGSWQPYGPCSVTCGTGRRTKVRTCIGGSCFGQTTATETCRRSTCPKRPDCAEPSQCTATLAFDPTLCSNAIVSSVCLKSCNKCPVSGVPVGVLGPWSKYGRCSRTCGLGTQTRTRKCFGGLVCFGSKKSNRNCNVRPCDKKWGPWGKYSPCSAKCGGGTQTKTRKCKQGNSCTGPSSSTRRCNTNDCRGSWGPWSSSACSRPCGGGTKTKTRKCNGAKCPGKSTLKVPCNTRKCGSPRGSWGPWSNYSKCSKPCNGGTQKRTRKCKRNKCPGTSFQNRRCNTKPCKSSGIWSPCTKSCGVGTRYKFDSSACRSGSNPNCLRSFEECNTKPCPRKTCPERTEYRYGLDYECCKLGGASRIINGKAARIEDWPWMVLLETRTSYICGGTIVSSQWIVTAGHCFGSSKADQLETTVYPGIQSYSQKYQVVPRRVEDVIRHPQFNAKSLEHDIALVKLRDRLTFSQKIKSVSLPRGEETPTDSTCYATGWGLTESNPSNPKPSEPLLQVGVQILDVAVCRKSYRQDSNVIEVAKEYVKTTKRLLCAGSLTKRNDACRGDSGGPLVCQRCSSCSWYIAGITSFGPPYDCGKPGYPGMYIKVKEYENWIYNHISELRGSKETCPYKYGP